MLVNVLLLQQQLELVASLTASAPYEFFARCLEFFEDLVHNVDFMPLREFLRVTSLCKYRDLSLLVRASLATGQR